MMTIWRLMWNIGKHIFLPRWWWCGNGSSWFLLKSCFDLFWPVFFCFGNWMRQGGGDVGIRRGMAVFAPPCFSPPPLETSPWEGFPAISNSKGREMWCKRGIFHFNCNTVLDKLGWRWLFCQGANRTCQCRGAWQMWLRMESWSHIQFMWIGGLLICVQAITTRWQVQWQVIV